VIYKRGEKEQRIMGQRDVSPLGKTQLNGMSEIVPEIDKIELDKNRIVLVLIIWQGKEKNLERGEDTGWTVNAMGELLLERAAWIVNLPLKKDTQFKT